MVRKGSLLGETLEQGGSIVKQTGKQVVKLPTDLARTAAKQAAAKQSATDQGKSQGEFVKGLYGTTDQKALAEQAEQKVAVAQASKQRSPEELEKIAQLRQKLHSETYFGELLSPPKPQEERPVEKVEREKMEELQGEQEKQAKKPPPLPPSARPGTVERKLGVSG